MGWGGGGGVLNDQEVSVVVCGEFVEAERRRESSVPLKTDVSWVKGVLWMQG